MSPDVFEDELRTLFHDATETHSAVLGDIDPTTVLDAGHRIVRRRRAAMVGGTAAVATVAALGTLAAFGDAVDRTAPPVPATRTTMVDRGIVEARLTAGDVAYTVRLDTGTGTIAALTGTGTDLRSVTSGSVDGSGMDAGWSVVDTDPLVVAGVVPAAATQLMTRFSPTVGGSTDVDGTLPGTPYKAVLWTSEESTADGELLGLDWSDGARVYDSRGREVPSVTFGDRLVYTDVEADEMGIVEPDGSIRTPMRSERAAGLPPRIIGGVQQTGQMETTAAFLLPAGATDATFVPRADTTVVSTDTKVLPGGGTVALARFVGPEQSGLQVVAVGWTVDGVRSTWRDGGQLTVAGGGASAVQLLLDVMETGGTTSVVARESGGPDLLNVASLRVPTAGDVGSQGVARRGDGAGSTRLVALVPKRPASVSMTGTPAAAFADGQWGWSTVQVPGTSWWAVGAAVHGQLDIRSWSSMTWTGADGVSTEFPVD